MKRTEDNTHVVYVEARKTLESNTLPWALLDKLQAAFRSARWWTDAWSHRKFLTAARSVVRDEGSLIILGPRLPFEMPPSFDHMFEPIEVARGLGEDDKRLRTLSGEKPTREERWRGVAIGIALFFAVGFAVFFGLAFMRGIPPRALLAIGGTVVAVVVLVALFITLRRWSGHWFLIPGGIAVVRRPVRRGQPARVTVLSRSDTVLAFRYISTGKSTHLMVELWTPLGKRLRRPVSQREAISILAAWQSPLPPPPDERLQELVAY